jgi:hypothetical protein
VEYLGNMKSMWNELAIYRPHTIEAATLLKRTVQYLGNMKNMWNELAIYRPHTIDAATLLK